MAAAETEAFDNLYELLKATSTQATGAAEDAAAAVFAEAARAAAPRASGQLAGSVKIIDSQIKGTLSFGTEIGNRRRLFVGPEKRRGFHGYFIETGWRTAGSKRIKRGTGGRAHSQKGSAHSRQIPGKPWFAPAIAGAESRAQAAAENAFNQELDRINSRK